MWKLSQEVYSGMGKTMSVDSGKLPCLISPNGKKNSEIDTMDQFNIQEFW